MGNKQDARLCYVSSIWRHMHYALRVQGRTHLDMLQIINAECLPHGTVIVRPLTKDWRLPIGSAL